MEQLLTLFLAVEGGTLVGCIASPLGNGPYAGCIVTRDGKRQVLLKAAKAA